MILEQEGEMGENNEIGKCKCVVIKLVVVVVIGGSMEEAADLGVTGRRHAMQSSRQSGWQISP